MPASEESILYEKQSALFDAYKLARKRLYEEGRVDTRKIHCEAIREAIHTPQPRFWISQYRTYRILQTIVNRKQSIKTWETRENLYKEIVAVYEKIKEKRMFRGMPLLFIATFVTFEPASGFFMSESRAGRAISAEFKRRRKMKLQNMQRH